MNEDEIAFEDIRVGDIVARKTPNEVLDCIEWYSFTVVEKTGVYAKSKGHSFPNNQHDKWFLIDRPVETVEVPKAQYDALVEAINTYSSIIVAQRAIKLHYAKKDLDDNRV